MNRISHQNGSVLLAALAILAILAATVSGILLYGTWQRARCITVLQGVKAEYLAEAGIHRAAAELSANPHYRVREFPVELDSSSRVLISVTPWGGFLRVTSVGQAGRTTRRMSAMIGQAAPELFINVITLIGKSYPLVVSGSTRISGRVAVAPPGVVKGEINGRRFLGDTAVDGEIIPRNVRNLPVADAGIIVEFVDSLKKLRANTRNRTDFSRIFIEASELGSDQEITASPLRSSASIELNLRDTTEVCGEYICFADRQMIVRGKTRLRNFVLCSEDEIIVEDETRLSDCILVGRKITFRGFARFDGQLIAMDTITVTNSAQLSHLSFVYVIGRSVAKRLEGLVAFHSAFTSCAFVFIGGRVSSTQSDSIPENCTRVMIGPESRLDGLVWTDGYMEPLGSFSGSAAVNLFSYYEDPTTYLNWLVDARLDYSAQSERAVLPLVFPHGANLRARDQCLVVR